MSSCPISIELAVSCRAIVTYVKDWPHVWTAIRDFLATSASKELQLQYHIDKFTQCPVNSFFEQEEHFTLLLTLNLFLIK